VLQGAALKTARDEREGAKEEEEEEEEEDDEEEDDDAGTEFSPSEYQTERTPNEVSRARPSSVRPPVRVPAYPRLRHERHRPSYQPRVEHVEVPLLQRVQIRPRAHRGKQHRRRRRRVFPIRASVGVAFKGVRSGVERRRGVSGLKARDPGRRETRAGRESP
jgi:hypothetical protein